MSDRDLLKEFLNRARHQVDADLDCWLPAPTCVPALLHEAMRYAVFSGGKRLRPALAFAAAEAAVPSEVTSAKAERFALARPVAVAVELLHAYSLVHDDLPAMDDDVERRGRPTVHVKFGEATAILAGDALLTAAFGRLAAPDVAGEHVANLVADLAHAAGSQQLVGGQADDLRANHGAVTRDEVISIHSRKTAALFQFALASGARVAGADSEQQERMREFGRCYGLAFQAADDLLDAGRKETSLLRVDRQDEVLAAVQGWVAEALSALRPLETHADPLRGLVESLVERAASG